MLSEKAGKKLNTPVEDYVIFDLETTGVDVNTDEVIEISAIRVRAGEPVEEFSTLVNPGRPIPFNATRINGITDEMVSDAPEFSKAPRGPDLLQVTEEFPNSVFGAPR